MLSVRGVGDGVGPGSERVAGEGVPAPSGYPGALPGCPALLRPTVLGWHKCLNQPQATTATQLCFEAQMPCPQLSAWCLYQGKCIL